MRESHHRRWADRIAALHCDYLSGKRFSVSVSCGFAVDGLFFGIGLAESSLTAAIDVCARIRALLDSVTA